MRHLTVEQRYIIEAYLKIGKSKDFISKELNVHRSTIYREIKKKEIIFCFGSPDCREPKCENSRQERTNVVRRLLVFGETISFR